MRVRTTASEVQILGDVEEIRATSLPISTRILQQMLLLIVMKINAVAVVAVCEEVGAVGSSFLQYASRM
jgi:hypothetical protein